MPFTKRLTAEFVGTLWLVLGGCGAAVLAAVVPNSNLGVGYVGVSLAFGLTVLTGAYALGQRFPGRDVLPYVLSQLLGGIAGAGILFLFASNKPGFNIGGFAANGFEDHSPGKYVAMACFISEVVMTFFF